MPKILTFLNTYLPGYKSGGPIRTLAAMVEKIGREFEFLIVTRDRDSGDPKPYAEVERDCWQQVGNAKVFYASSKILPPTLIQQITDVGDLDMIYLNSFFNPYFTIQPLILRKIGILPKVPTIVAPRGEFSPGALRLKERKKAVFIKLARAARLYSDVIWQASSRHEAEDIRRVLGSDAGQVIVAPDLALGNQLGTDRRPPKETGVVDIVFLSRIVPKKNLDGALRLLNGLDGNVNFNIYGPLEDLRYWKSCQELIRRLPQNVRVEYRGELVHEEVATAFGSHHLFLFPTHGENFGHVILESLLAGCPVLISDQTPWKDLAAAGAGWQIPLDNKEDFRNRLQRFIGMGQEEFQTFSSAALAHAREVSEDPIAIEQNRKLFRHAHRKG